MFINKWF